jgi:hypothetical protein
MKSKFIKSIALLGLIAGVVSCANNDDYSTPTLTGVVGPDCVEPSVAVNKTVSAVNAMANSSIQLYTADDVIEAYVTSNDERGNFFKSISLQTLPADGPVIGFSVVVDGTTLFGQGFYPGRKVYIKLKDLYYSRVDGSLRLGDEYRENPTAPVEIGRIDALAYRNHIMPSCTEVNEDQLVRTMTIDQALNDANINTLIELQNVQFIDDNVGKTYYDENDLDNTIGGATNRYLMNGDGDQVIFRTSGFSNFAGSKVPGQSGRVRGVLTKFGDDYQFMARQESDVMLTEPRIDVAPPIVGSTITYAGTYTENFESYATNNRIFPRAINDAAVGTRYWEVKLFGGNKYIQMTSFGGAAEANRTLFIVPVDMTAANTLSFQTKAGYDNGAALKVYYTTNYTPGGDITQATLVNITSSFNIPAGPSTGYATNFTNSGVYNIPAGVTGNGFFVFEYRGNGNSGVTTTMQIDNIVIN